MVGAWDGTDYSSEALARYELVHSIEYTQPPTVTQLAMEKAARDPLSQLASENYKNSKLSCKDSPTALLQVIEDALRGRQ